jgi:hypothetical protein
MDDIPTPTADVTAAALVVARSNGETLKPLSWLFRRMAAAQEEISVLLEEVGRRRASLPPRQPT